jgi:tripartite-type tricarboxylate transporter receptor subunit TctC
MFKRSTLAAVAACIAWPVWSPAQPVLAQTTFPSKPITWVVGFAPGGGVDGVTRLVAAKLSQNLGQQVVVENRPGASSIIAAQYVAQAPADGYTLLSIEQGIMLFNAAMYSKLPYDAARDFAPVTNMIKAPLLLAVGAGVPATDLAALIDLAKKRPDSLSYGSPGRGLAHHIAMEVFKDRTGIQIAEIQYKGIAPVIQDVTGGQVPVAAIDTVVILPHLKSGKIRALASFSKTRLSVTPQIPSLAELGYADMDIAPIVGAGVPKATPREIVNRLNAEIVRAVRDPEVSAKLTGLGLEIVADTPEQFASFLEAESRRLLPVVKRLDIKLD